MLLKGILPANGRFLSQPEVAPRPGGLLHGCDSCRNAAPVNCFFNGLFKNGPMQGARSPEERSVRDRILEIRRKYFTGGFAAVTGIVVGSLVDPGALIGIGAGAVVDP